MTDDNAPGWRPIESMPSGTGPFLLCAQDDLNTFYFVAQTGAAGDFILEWDGHPLTEAVFGKFVGWRPLPPPPSQEG